MYINTHVITDIPTVTEILTTKCRNNMPYISNVLIVLNSAHWSLVKLDSTLTQMSRVRVESVEKFRQMILVRVRST